MGIKTKNFSNLKTIIIFCNLKQSKWVLTGDLFTQALTDVLTGDLFTQDLPVHHHPLDAGYYSVVDEPQLSLIFGFTLVTQFCRK
jgi:hypothetical protein